MPRENKDKRQKMKVVPVTFKRACEFVTELHRHNKAPRGHKFSIGLADEDGKLVGVA
ncbi:XF1762 family protein, partial [Macrococcoides canis]|uniref:XF1762 family protein n=1 Tax=Macrococcoides canis TaxID=1855823 RepID=UPI0039C8E449